MKLKVSSWHSMDDVGPAALAGFSMGGLIAVLTLQSDHGLPLRGAVLGLHPSL